MTAVSLVLTSKVYPPPFGNLEAFDRLGLPRYAVELSARQLGRSFSPIRSISARTQARVENRKSADKFQARGTPGRRLAPRREPHGLAPDRPPQKADLRAGPGRAARAASLERASGVRSSRRGEAT